MKMKNNKQTYVIKSSSIDSDIICGSSFRILVPISTSNLFNGGETCSSLLNTKYYKLKINIGK